MTTLPDFTSYIPPGVYVADVTTPIVTPTGVPSNYLVLAGPALGYRTATQSFLIDANDAVQLTFTGVFTTAVTGPPPIAAPVVILTASGTTLISGTDYTLTVTPDPSGDPSLAVTTVTRSSTSTTVSDGQEVTITYNYADATYYQPQVFTDPRSVMNAYGPPLLSAAPAIPGASQVANPLSFAAQVAFGNGANTIIAVACNPSDGSLEQQLSAAYAKLATTYPATLIVPVFPDDLTVSGGSTVDQLVEAVAGDLKAACVSAASSGYPRIGILGLPRNYPESTTPITALAATIGSKRVILAYPEVVNFFNGLTGQTFGAAGCYLAVALGALLSSLPVNTGLTGQVLSGFSGLPSSEAAAMTPATLNAMAGAGTTIVSMSRRGALACRHGLTTDMSALNNREISLVRQADALFTSVLLGMENSGLIGQPITAEMAATVWGALSSILEQAVNQNIIVSWQNLSVVQETYPGGDPTVMDCSFEYLPAVPLNYIDITFSINLGSGAVATQSQQNALAGATA